MSHRLIVIENEPYFLQTNVLVLVDERTIRSIQQENLLNQIRNTENRMIQQAQLLNHLQNHDESRTFRFGQTQDESRIFRFGQNHNQVGFGQYYSQFGFGHDQSGFSSSQMTNSTDETPAQRMNRIFGLRHHAF